MKKFFGRGGRQAQLQDLYRRAELGGEVGDADPALQQEFAADQQLMQQLGRFASQSAPANAEMGRATFLTAVARQRSESLEKERRHLFGHTLGARGLALLAAAGIFAGGAITVGASGGVDGAAGHVQNVLATLRITERAPNQATTHLDAADHQPDVSVTSVASGHPVADAQPSLGANDCTTTPTVTLTATSSPTATNTPSASTTADNHDADETRSGGRECGTKGIPTTNPNHQPEATPGSCHKGETAIKTTPSGAQVSVPCQAADGGVSEGASTKTPESKDKTPEATDTRELTKTPESHGDNNGQSSGHGETGDHQP
jgi:hypothetical protein